MLHPGPGISRTPDRGRHPRIRRCLLIAILPQREELLFSNLKAEQNITR